MQTPECQHELTSLYHEEGLIEDSIKVLLQQPIPDALSIQRLKRRHQFLKNEISKLRDWVIPNIIA